MSNWAWYVTGWQNNQGQDDDQSFSKVTKIPLTAAQGIRRLIFRQSFAGNVGIIFDNPVPSPGTGAIMTNIYLQYGQTGRIELYDQWNPYTYGGGWLVSDNTLSGRLYWTCALPTWETDIAIRRAPGGDDQHALNITVEESFIPIGTGPQGFVYVKPSLVGWSSLHLLTYTN